MNRQRSLDLAERTDQVSLKPYDQAHALPRPGEIGDTYAEREYDELTAEQEQLWPADGAQQAQSPAEEAAQAEPESTAATEAMGHTGQQLADATAQHEQARRVLGPWCRRAPDDHFRYRVTLGLLGIGDTAGVWASAVALGEVPLIALGQAVATGCAAVTAGLVGGEVRNAASARERAREPDQLSADEQVFRRLFTAPAAGAAPLRIACGVGMIVIALIALGVFALRTGVEGLLAGLTFGGLAAATALASFVSSYVHADEVADLLERYANEQRAAERHHLRLSRNRSLGRRAGALSTVASIEREFAMRAAAAAHHVQALKYRLLRQNPQVVGHGFAASPAEPVGRRARDLGSTP